MEKNQNKKEKEKKDQKNKAMNQQDRKQPRSSELLLKVPMTAATLAL